VSGNASIQSMPMSLVLNYKRIVYHCHQLSLLHGADQYIIIYHGIQDACET
jgi:hypothetical protein